MLASTPRKFVVVFKKYFLNVSLFFQKMQFVNKKAEELRLNDVEFDVKKN